MIVTVFISFFGLIMGQKATGAYDEQDCSRGQEVSRDREIRIKKVNEKCKIRYFFLSLYH